MTEQFYNAWKKTLRPKLLYYINLMEQMDKAGLDWYSPTLGGCGNCKEATALRFVS